MNRDDEYSIKRKKPKKLQRNRAADIDSRISPLNLETQIVRQDRKRPTRARVFGGWPAWRKNNHLNMALLNAAESGRQDCFWAGLIRQFAGATRAKLK